ncbi:MAG: hypothetical protein HWD83_07110 [Gammaproteobacteria bacterium]|nr:hypothetical protein [Gammaproteobacteria bacterium]
MRFLILGLIIFSVTPSFATADDANTFIHPSMERNHVLLLGSFRQRSDAQINTSSSSRSLGFDLQNLGLRKSDTNIAINYRYRLTERLNLTLAYSDYIDRGSRSLNSQVDFNDTIYDVGVTVESEFRTRNLSTRLVYDYYQSPTTTLGIGLGIHALELKASIAGSGRINDTTSPTYIRETDSLLAPLPNIMLTATHAFNSRLLVSGSAGWLSANIDPYDGETRFIEGMIEYRVSDHFSLAAAYQLIDLNVDHRGRLLNSQYSIQQGGPMLLVKWSF